MVSTRKKAYKSPPYVGRLPTNSAKKKDAVKKLFYHPTPTEKSESPRREGKKIDFKLKSAEKKKHVTENAESDMDVEAGFVIDKTPNKLSYEKNISHKLSKQSGDADIFNVKSGLLESEPSPSQSSDNLDLIMDESVDDHQEAEKTSHLFVMDKKPIPVTKDFDFDGEDENSNAEEELYEIDMTNISSASKDPLRNLDTSLNESDMSEDEFEEDEEVNTRPSQVRKSDSKMTMLNKPMSDSDGETSNSELFVIDKGPIMNQKNITDLFTIDKGPSHTSQSNQEDDEEESSSSESEDESSQKPPAGYNLASRIKCPINLEHVSYINFNPLSKQPQKNKLIEEVKNKKVEELMKRSNLKPGFEQQKFVDPIKGKRQKKREGRAERAKTKGGKWYDMAAPEMTSELKNDLTVVQMRRALDPKRFYKSNDMQGLPKYFQMGRVVESAAEFYHARVPKKQRKANIVEELLADAQFKKYNKRKYAEIQEKTMQRSRGAYKHMKRLKKRKK